VCIVVDLALLETKPIITMKGQSKLPLHGVTGSQYCKLSNNAEHLNEVSNMAFSEITLN
jgi:hypothetical protein